MCAEVSRVGDEVGIPSALTLSRVAPVPRDERPPQRKVTTAAGARKTPNGTSGASKGSPARRLRIQANGMTTRREGDCADESRQTKIVRSVRCGPKAAPIDCHQRDVPETHCLLAERDLAQPADDRDGPRAHTGADQRVVWRRKSARAPQKDTGDRGQEDPGKAENREPIGDEIVQEIGDSDAGQDRDKDRHAQRREWQWIDRKGRHPCERDSQLYRRILDRDPESAPTASTAQREPTQHGHVLVPRDRALATRTARPWGDDGELHWPASNTHVEERANERAPNADRCPTTSRTGSRQVRLRRTRSPGPPTDQRLPARSLPKLVEEHARRDSDVERVDAVGRESNQAVRSRAAPRPSGRRPRYRRGPRAGKEQRSRSRAAGRRARRRPTA